MTTNQSRLLYGNRIAGDKADIPIWTVAQVIGVLVPSKGYLAGTIWVAPGV